MSLMVLCFIFWIAYLMNCQMSQNSIPRPRPRLIFTPICTVWGALSEFDSPSTEKQVKVMKTIQNTSFWQKYSVLIITQFILADSHKGIDRIGSRKDGISSHFPKAWIWSRAENKGASNVNDVPRLAFDAPNQNLTRHDDASDLSFSIDKLIK